MSMSRVLCIDTEFHRENTYDAQFALLQIASRDDCFVIDPQAIEDLKPVWDVLLRPDILKVFHAGRQDMEIILKEAGALPLPIFDTQIAASLLGHGLQIGFGNLVQKIVKKVLAKQESYSDWLARPLTPHQLEYAAEDVIYLMPVYQHLKERLQARGRSDWLQEEQALLCDPATFTIDEREVFWRVKGSNKLKPRQLAVLRELAAWREREAARLNQPRRRIMADEPLLEMARKDKLSLQSMERFRGVSAGTIKRFGEAVLQAWTIGQQCPEHDWPKLPERNHHTSGTELRLELLDTLVRLKAEQEDIAPTILASKSDLALLASWGKKRAGPPPDIACLHGWRYKMAGEDALRLLNGELALRLDPKTGLPVIEPLPGISSEARN